MRVFATLRRLVERTRPVHPETRRVLDERWAALPEHVRTPAQTLGRHAVGCEGTHGVFPKCNLTCTPCYHSADANKIRVDGEHTLAQIESQMGYLRERRGPFAHAQLIGGEVSLLPPDDHAAALQAMRAAGREPMSMTHGDFDADYLRAVALDAEGRPRFRRLSFAAHVDSLMRGRRGAVRPRSEAELHEHRRAFVRMFADLKAQHGVDSFLAHNMTVTPANLDEVAEVVRAVLPMGFGMMSFQPAAFVGDERRWRGGDYDEVTIDAVWQRIEEGLGTRASWAALAFGDPRCNRTAYGLVVDGRWYVYCDDASPVDLAGRDAFLAHFGGVAFTGTPPALLVVKVLRVLARHPGDLVVASRWLRGFVARVGGLRRLVGAARRGRVGPMNIVVHAFMDAADVAPAWAAMKAGETATEPRVLAAQERLAACTYSMAHPETGELVPACAQHSVLDVVENAELRTLLPLTVV